LAGIDDPSRVTIYTPDLSGIAGFQTAPTSYDDAANELVAQVSGFSEFVFASDTEPLPVEMAGFEAAVDEGQFASPGKRPQRRTTRRSRSNAA
jgi:hypothetical protein